MSEGFTLAQRMGLDGPSQVGLLQPDGPIFRLRGEPWRYKGVSAFKLCDHFRWGRMDLVDSFLAAYQGFNVLRVWDYVGAGWGAQAWNSSPPDVWVEFLRYVGGKGFWVELTLLTDDDPTRIDPARALVWVLAAASVKNLLFEAGNEPTTNKAIHTAALQSVLASTPFPFSSGDYEDSTRWFGTYYTCHTARTSDWPRRAHDLLEFFTGDGPDQPTHPHKVPCVGDEPGKREDVGGHPLEWRAYFGGCALMGAGATFHSETGKFGQPPTSAEVALAGEALLGLSIFPPDAPIGIPATYRRIVEPGQSPTARTYVVGSHAVRSQQSGLAFPEPGWTSLEPGGILWTR